MSNMDSNVIEFPFGTSRKEFARKSRASKRRSSGVNIRTLIFRSYDLIVESDEAELARDVCRDTRKAEVKLPKVRERLRGVQEQSAAQIQLLTAAETKLSAAISIALSSTRREG